MPCSAQNDVTAPRGASAGHCEIAKRTRGSTGSTPLIHPSERQKCHHQESRNCHRCPRVELSPMSRDITSSPLDAAPTGLMQSLERGECLSTARHRSASCHHFSGAPRNPTRDPGRPLMCGASRGLGFNKRHSVATSFEHLMGGKTDKAMTRTSPYRASNSHAAQRVPE